MVQTCMCRPYLIYIIYATRSRADLVAILCVNAPEAPITSKHKPSFHNLLISQKSNTLLTLPTMTSTYTVACVDNM